MMRDYNSPERMQEMLKAIRTVSAERCRIVRCPYCGHRCFEVTPESVGYLKTKCAKCKKEVAYNLVSMRRVKPWRQNYTATH